TPDTDYLAKLKISLLAIDTSLTFKIAHTDLSWTKLVATTNTQGRYLNGSNDPCFTAAASSNGRFLHIEQALTGLRDNAANRKKLSDAIALTFPENSNVVSGNWNAADTWMKGSVPKSTEDVFITSGTTVSITGTTDSCKTITFDSDNTHLAMQNGAILHITGDFTLSSATHNVFSSWSAGAKIKFTGSSTVQTLSGWSTSAFSTSFAELVIDKSSGKVTTSGTGMRFSFGTYLTISNGTFELNTTDDIETRNIAGSASAATITVGAGGILKLLGDDSYIRNGSNTDTVTSRTGKMTIYGKAYLATTSTNRLNFGNIDVESGGELQFTTGWTGASGAFNAGIVTVKDGGLLTVGTTQTLWHATSSLNLQQSGKLVITSSTVGLPNQCLINGDVEYSRSGIQTLSNKISTYNTVVLGGSGTKTLAANALVTGKLTMSGTASLASGSFALSYAPGAALSYASTATAQTTASTEFPAANGPGTVIIENTLGVTLHASRTIAALLHLSNGIFTNNPGVLTIGAGALIKRTQNSQLSSVPVFASTVNLEYLNSAPLTTGNELPANPSVINNITLSGNAEVTIDKNITVNGVLNLGTVKLHTSSNTISFGTGSYSPTETDTSYISGNAIMLPRSVGVDSLQFLGVNITGIGDAGTLSITRMTGNFISGPSNQSTACSWTVNSSKDSITDKLLMINWFPAHDNSKLFSAANKAIAWYNTGTPAVWQNTGGFQDVSTSLNRSLQFPLLGSAVFTASDSLHPLRPTMYAQILMQGFWNGTTTITDTLHAEMRSAVTPYTILESASSVCDTLGYTAFHYSGITNSQPYYFSIRHRNAITTWSAAPVQFTNGVRGYVFTDAVSKAFGGNQIIVSGKACLLGGDVNQDGFVDFSDLTLIDNDAYTFTSGYVATDLNGDSFVDFSDLTICDNNAYNFVSVVTPQAAGNGVNL
ncbi:MAG: hypothetical protein HY965_07235, partial [Ignavibacteriales bacterium]|nr:hypothetical protein [Ignavibacteriales bacterium]